MSTYLGYLMSKPSLEKDSSDTLAYVYIYVYIWLYIYIYIYIYAPLSVSVSLVNGISTYLGYLMSKPSLEQDSSGTIVYVYMSLYMRMSMYICMYTYMSKGFFA